MVAALTVPLVLRPAEDSTPVDDRDVDVNAPSEPEATVSAPPLDRAPTMTVPENVPELPDREASSTALVATVSVATLTAGTFRL